MPRTRRPSDKGSNSKSFGAGLIPAAKKHVATFDEIVKRSKTAWVPGYVTLVCHFYLLNVLRYVRAGVQGFYTDTQRRRQLRQVETLIRGSQEPQARRKAIPPFIFVEPTSFLAVDLRMQPAGDPSGAPRESRDVANRGLLEQPAARWAGPHTAQPPPLPPLPVPFRRGGGVSGQVVDVQS